jgi:antitoxin StbD
MQMHVEDRAMGTLLTRQIATITELREPRKLLDRAGDNPLALRKNSQPVACVVPVERLEEAPEHHPATREELQSALGRTPERAQPVCDYLQDK